MKLARKIVLALALLAFAVIAGLEVLEVHRELASAREDMVHDHALLGRALGAAVEKAWQLEGEAEATALVRQASQGHRELQVRWVWLDAPGPHEVTSRVDERSRPGTLYTRVPLSTGGRPAALEIAESLSHEAAHLRRTLWGTALAGGSLALLFLLAAWWLGRTLVGAPVERLVGMAHAIAQGELGARVTLQQGDELDALGAAMNRMSERLAEARAHLEAETAARLAALEHLRHADRLTTVGKLASGVAHELGTPLNVVGGHARMIATREVEGEGALDSARVISEQAQVMTRIIRQLLDFARPRPPQRAPTDLGALAVRCLELLRPLAAKKGARLVPPEPASAVRAVPVDAAQLQQVLTNLVMNAVQALEGPGEVRVALVEEVRAPPTAPPGSPPSRWVRVDVRDTGRGIPPDVLPRIFEPFFTTKDVGEGTGLGLSVSYGIVRDHGGWIDVQSAPGEGSRFSVYLPAED